MYRSFQKPHRYFPPTGFLGILLAVCLIFLIGSPGAGAAEAEGTSVPVRIGWQMPAATQGQIVQVLKRTDLLESHGLSPVLIPFSYGGPQVEAALAGELDVVFAGGQPAVNLIAQGGKWKIVARLFYDRTAVMVPPGSPIKETKDLKGKTVASSFGSVAHRDALLAQQAAGLDSEKDVTNVDMDILDIRQQVKEGGAETWGKLDAVAVWEPSTSFFEIAGLARRVGETTQTLGVVAISENFIAKHPKATVQLLVALQQAWGYFTIHEEQVRQWYIDDTQLDYTPEALRSAAKVDPNFDARSIQEIDMNLTEEHITALERSAAWACERGYSEIPAPIRSAVDQSLMAKAQKEIAADHFDAVHVILPSAREIEKRDVHETFVLDALPIGVFFVISITLSALAIEMGRWLGARRRRRTNHESDRALGTVVSALLSLLAFVVALTFGTSTARFTARKNAMLDDVNAISASYLRAGLLPEPHRTTVRNLLRDYLEVRIGMTKAESDPVALSAVTTRAESLQGSLWSHAEDIAEADKTSWTYSLFASSLNTVFDQNTKRIVFGVQFRIPSYVWVALLLVSTVAMTGVGFLFGLTGGRSNIASLLLPLNFAVVMTLIFDLDRPGEGLITVNQQAMTDLYYKLSLQK